MSLQINTIALSLSFSALADASVLSGATVIFPLQIAFIPITVTSLDVFPVSPLFLSTCDWLPHVSVRNNAILLAESQGRDVRDQLWLVRVQATSGFTDFE